MSNFIHHSNVSSPEPYKTIYMQYCADKSNFETWCQDRVNDGDIEYVLKSDYDELEKQNKELVEFIVKKYLDFIDISLMPNLNIDVKIFLEKIKQKPIEEILKDYQ